MTDVQVFKWFCKEQGIMANIRGMYYVSAPKKYSLSKVNSGFYKLSFEEWIHDLISSRGFHSLLYKIGESYNCNLLYSQYDHMIPNIGGMYTDKFRKAMQRWSYFVSKNLIVDEISLKVGDVINYKNPFKWDDPACERVVVDSISVKDGYVSGHLEGTNGDLWENKRDFMNFSYLRKLDNPEEQIDINYSIKRNRRVYNGANR
jgi:hypothetical protein